ncbi:hypothetical protein TanjilG_27474 [Lupinus angustifolius]|uniref:Meiosis 1 arrest protein n=1 Tax=Lupinus angustifolius TaxID=3871 RepID=A0A4P1R2T9_LUPAN|nr:hypothetical protein TanjilG_27474 [Lupinus angustifolius]
MVQVCFVLDLRSLAPPLLRDLKKSLFQLANFYAVSTSTLSDGKSAALADKIGLCYIFKNRLSSSDELKIAYTPTASFNLRDFHHAVNNLPSDAFLPHTDNSSDAMISNVLSDQVLYSWQGKDIEKRVIFITSNLPEDVDSIMTKTLMVLKDDMEEPLLARFTLKDNLLDSVDHIFCNLFALVNPITNSFSHCQTCRCHGMPLRDVDKNFNRVSCPATGCNLEARDVIENSVRLEEKTVLFLSSAHKSLKPLKVASPIDMTVTARINLASLDEGLIMGAPFIVIPSPNHVIQSTSDDVDQSDVNSQQTIAKALYRCYYILQSSDNGPMLLKRLAGAEVLRVPDNHLVDSSVSKEIENSVQACLLKIDLTDYDPLLHECGFHQKINSLVKESLQLGSISPKLNTEFSELSPSPKPSPKVIRKARSATDVIVVDEETMPLNITDQDEKTMACITEEWKQLVVNEDHKINSPSSMSKPNLTLSIVSPRNENRQVDRETSKILERLEVPRSLKAKAASPVFNESCMKNTSLPTKKPLIPFQATQGTEQSSLGSQLIKPSFHRQRRKIR